MHIVASQTCRPEFGAFLNPRGFDRDKLPTPRPPWYKAVLRPLFGQLEHYEITLHRDAPLMFRWPDGRLWQTDWHFISDGGSVPPLLHTVVGEPDHFLLAYLFHDSAYCHHCVYEAPNAIGAFVKRQVTKAEADRALYDMVLVEGGLRPTAAAIWTAVSGFAWIPWNKKRDLRRPNEPR